MAKAKLNLDKPFKVELSDMVDDTTKIPVVVSADVSYSMQGAPLQEQGDAIQTFVETLLDDDYARPCVELSIMTFSDDVKVIQDYDLVDNIYFENNLEVENMTNMGKGVNIAIDSLESKLQSYKAEGTNYKAPLLLVITDGVPSDDITDAAKRCAELIAKQKLSFMGIGVGDGVDMSQLKRFNPNGKVVQSPTHDDLKELLVWVSYALSEASKTAPGEEVQNHAELDPKFKLF